MPLIRIVPLRPFVEFDFSGLDFKIQLFVRHFLLDLIAFPMPLWIWLHVGRHPLKHALREYPALHVEASPAPNCSAFPLGIQGFLGLRIQAAAVSSARFTPPIRSAMAHAISTRGRPGQSRPELWQSKQGLPQEPCRMLGSGVVGARAIGMVGNRRWRRRDPEQCHTFSRHCARVGPASVSRKLFGEAADPTRPLPEMLFAVSWFMMFRRWAMSLCLHVSAWFRNMLFSPRFVLEFRLHSG